MSAVPVYYELSWSILSTIGLLSCLIGVYVSGIVGFTSLSAVPIITSAAGAIANGLCYYAFYADYSEKPRLVAGIFADLTWLIQEAGLGFYSYQILRRLLRGTEKTVFYSIYWTLMVGITAVRCTIVVERALSLVETSSQAYTDGSRTFPDRQTTINHLHVGYFTQIALAETASAFFLLRIFTRAQKRATSSVVGGGRQSLFKVLTRSTEIRLAILGPIGICRSITYSFQVTSQSATNLASQFDRFAYTLECIFPIILIVDLLASKRIGQDGSSSGVTSVSFYRGPGATGMRSQGATQIQVTRMEHVDVDDVDVKAGKFEMKSHSASSDGNTGYTEA
ncbi:hypothetical protein BDN72DRAFT_76322 [Pluteus cervinus]|uniref:Uncharacterized protein n=1 Tax=Pluteus cervinus TaxID=181527 RepID=A0ACD3APB9_9AGAR|nr:hypothetical protein BDN72DRAFT_76322 [Pluteus cervinus]